MKKLYFIFAMVFIASCTQKTQPETTDQSFKVFTDTSIKANVIDTQYKFEAWFPSVPQVQYDTFIQDTLSIVYKTYYVDFTDSFYMITVVEYPEHIIDLSDAREVLLNSHHSAMHTQGLKSDFEAVKKIDSLWVLYYKNRSNRFYLLGMNIIKDNKMFQILTVNQQHYPSQQIINRFLGAFKIIDSTKKK